MSVKYKLNHIESMCEMYTVLVYGSVNINDWYYNHDVVFYTCLTFGSWWNNCNVSYNIKERGKLYISMQFPQLELYDLFLLYNVHKSMYVKSFTI